MGLVTSLGHGGNKRITAAGSWHFTRKNLAEHHVPAIDGTSRVVVLLDNRTFQRQAGEHAFRARVGQHFSVQQYVSSGGSMTADWTRCHRSFTSKFELGGEQMLQ